jgi:tetratricopeptide (TPR) repeat protein
MRNSVGLGMILVLLFLGAAAGGWVWYGWPPRDESLSPDSPEVVCLSQTPPGFDLDRLVILQFTPQKPSWVQDVFEEDLEELLLAGSLHVLSAQSEAAVLPPNCVAWRVEIDREIIGEKRICRLSILRFGRIVATLAADIPDGDEGLIPAKLRRAIAERLGLASRGSRLSLFDPASKEFRIRASAMRLEAEGKSGEAARLLLGLKTATAADAGLSYRLGRILGSWGEEMLSAGRSPLWESRAGTESLEAEGRERLVEAGRHLDRALELDPDQPLALFVRGRVDSLAGQSQLARAKLSRALELWPAYGEAAGELARLRLADGEADGLELLLESALRSSDSRRRGLRASLLAGLGKTGLSRGRPEAAVTALSRALELLPVEQRRLRIEVLRQLARAQADLGDLTAACATWQAQFGLGAGEPWSFGGESSSGETWTGCRSQT